MCDADIELAGSIGWACQPQQLGSTQTWNGRHTAVIGPGGLWLWLALGVTYLVMACQPKKSSTVPRLEWLEEFGSLVDRLGHLTYESLQPT